MTNFDYNTDIPFATNDPSADQPLMQQNTNSIDGIIAVDHISFGFDNGGYHKIIHQDPGDRSVTATGANNYTYNNFPANIIGPPKINQIFTALYTPDTTGGVADTQLFNKTANGVGTSGISQLTGNLSGDDGWCWVGGILIQWGIVTGLLNLDHQTNGVTFKDRVTGAIPFPNNCFIVNATLIPTNSSTDVARAVVSINSISRTQFVWVVNQSGQVSGNRYTDFYWFAIGN